MELPSFSFFARDTTQSLYRPTVPRFHLRYFRWIGKVSLKAPSAIVEIDKTAWFLARYSEPLSFHVVQALSFQDRKSVV